jgi:UPF0271 protein
MITIDINCDMAEGLPTDALLMPYISSANIACGYHAGNESVMKRTVELAVENAVAIGAHPGFADKKNFGRTEMQLPLAQVYDLVTEQLYILKKITGTKLHHIKPHGALYNMSARDPLLANTIAKAVFDFDDELLLFGLSGSHSITEAQKAGLNTASEVFADRTYQPNGSLTPRSQPNALIENTPQALEQALQMIQQQTVTAVNGKPVAIVADTICIHGDGPHAVDFAMNIYLTLQQHHIGIQTL